MAGLLGDGSFTFEVLEDWAKLPEDWYLKDVGGVGVDSRDRVYVFNRGNHPMIVLDSEGNVLSTWGEGIFTRPHGVTMGPDETIYCTDDGDHTVRKCTLDGKILMTLGNPGNPAVYQSGVPFNRCTHVAIDPNSNDLYVADGYGNSRVHKYSPDGSLLFSWGEPGTDPGQFNIVHNISTDRDGYVYVADRENHRVQVFDAEGKFQAQWVNLHRPCAIYMDDSSEQLCFIGELGSGNQVNENMPNIGPRVSILNCKGDRLSRIGDIVIPGASGQFIAPHCIAVDSKGDMYVGEVSWTSTGRFLDPPKELRCLQKFTKRT